MRFLKADLDMRLLFLILVVITVFVGMNVYYQNYILDMQKEYDQKVINLIEIEEKLLQKEKELNEISEQQKVLEKDKEVLENGYISLQSENENLELEKKTLLESAEQKPFEKTLCKATGNVVCLN